MSNPVDLEFPYSNSQVGPTFLAGGAYDPSKESKDRKDAAVRITCWVSGPTLPEVQSTVFESNESGILPWFVTFTLTGVFNHNNCKVEAFLWDGSKYVSQDTTTGITISSTGQPGGGIIITVPPP